MNGEGQWTRNQRKQQIINLLLWKAMADDGEFYPAGHSTVEIGRMAGLKATGYLRAILRDLAQEKCLLQDYDIARNGAEKHIWTLSYHARWIEPYRSVIDAMLAAVEDDNA